MYASELLLLGFHHQELLFSYISMGFQAKGFVNLDGIYGKCTACTWMGGFDEQAAAVASREVRFRLRTRRQSENSKCCDASIAAYDAYEHRNKPVECNPHARVGEGSREQGEGTESMN